MVQYKVIHQDAATAARVEYDSFLTRLDERKYGGSQVDIYIYGTVIRINETIESMFHNAAGAPDNTLKILFRHILENTVRIRYLAQAPNERIKEFEIAEMDSRLRIIGREKRANEPAERQEEREKLVRVKIERTNELRQAYDTPENKKLPKITFESMCAATGDHELYGAYRLFSQFEHSTGVGLMGTVVDPNSGRLVINKELSSEQVRLLWDSVARTIAGVEQALDMLDSNRPE